MQAATEIRLSRRGLVGSLWAVATFALWCNALFYSGEPASPSWLTVAASANALMVIWLRLPSIWGLKLQQLGASHAYWLLSLAASIHCMGYVLLRSATMLAALPALLLIVLAEIWTARAVRPGILPWFGQLSRRAVSGFRFLVGLPEDPTPVGQPSRTDAAQTDRPGSGPPTEAIPERTSDLRDPPLSQLELRLLSQEPASPDTACLDLEREPALEPESSSDSTVIRTTTEGRDDSGMRCLHGMVRICLEPGQKNDSVMIGFCPAFDGIPQIDLECDSENASASLLGCTPRGARVAITRASSSGNAAAADNTLAFAMHWYAAEPCQKIYVQDGSLP